MVVKIENNLRKISNKIEELIEEKSSGILKIKKEQKLLIEIYLYSGRLQYVVEPTHRIRRWQRNIAENCPSWETPVNIPKNQPWEYELLANGISKKQLDLTQVKSVIIEVTKECLLTLNNNDDLTLDWEALERPRSALAYCLTLSSSEMKALLSHIEQIKEELTQMGFKAIKPSLAPIETGKVNSSLLPVPAKYFTGNHTLWDIAIQNKMSLTKLLHELKPLIKNKILNFKELPDVAISKNKVEQNQKTPTASTPSPGNYQQNKQTKKGVIACIDDSLVVGFNLKKILIPMGYDVLIIQEPMAGFGELINKKPDVILLDLNMPNANGYSICKFLRETPVFNQTPIIILTSQDTMVDRTRAKLVGATDFLSKPPEAEVLLTMLNNLLVH